MRIVDDGETYGLRGRVEVKLGGKWGTVCNYGLIENGKATPRGTQVAKVICRSLGFPTTGYSAALPSSRFADHYGR